jgi:apolipoprotein N-acyltransferase
VTWTALEWSRAHLPSTLAFPWLGLGTSLTGFPELVGIAEIVGARGVTFWIALVNGVLAGLILNVRKRRAWMPWAVSAAVLLAGPMGWGVWRARSLEMFSVGRVALVQPNIAQRIKLDPTRVEDSTFASLDGLVERIEPGSVDLVVFPEVTLPVRPFDEASAFQMARVQSYSREVGAPILFGAYGYEPLDGAAFVPFNSAFLMEPQGLTDFQYDKRYLVPVVERAPFASAGVFRGLPRSGEYGVGRGWPLLEAGEALFGVLICYESTYPEASRQFRLAGADVLVNITNDAWYGREESYARTTALWQHPAHMVMRAIENRVGVARSANTGISLFVDPVGRVYDPSPLFEEDVRVDEVFTSGIVTFYTRFGDLVGGASALVALLLLLSALRGRRSLDRPGGLV